MKSNRNQQVGIIGAGNIGLAVARHLLKAGYSVIVSNSKEPSSLDRVIEQLGDGARGGTVKEAAEADMVLLAVPWTQVPTLSGITDWKDRTVIDATNHFLTHAPEFKLADLGGKASSQVVAQFLPGAHIVKAFNTLYYKILSEDPHEGNGRRIIFVSGDFEEPKQKVKEVVLSLGFAVIDLGTLANGGRLQEPKQAVANLNLIQLT